MIIPKFTRQSDFLEMIDHSSNEAILNWCTNMWESPQTKLCKEHFHFSPPYFHTILWHLRAIFTLMVSWVEFFWTKKLSNYGLSTKASLPACGSIFPALWLRARCRIQPIYPYFSTAIPLTMEASNAILIKVSCSIEFFHQVLTSHRL